MKIRQGDVKERGPYLKFLYEKGGLIREGAYYGLYGSKKHDD